MVYHGPTPIVRGTCRSLDRQVIHRGPRVVVALRRRTRIVRIIGPQGRSRVTAKQDPAGEHPLAVGSVLPFNDAIP